jgi:hypothetical protein
MTMKNDGGPAYPAPAQPKTDWSLEDVTSGMSLRDWFAGQALAGLFRHSNWIQAPDAEEVARRAYVVADAMLAERSKP